MPKIKRPLNAFGLQVMVKLNTFELSQAELAQFMGVKPSNLSEAMHKENPSGLFISKWTNRVNEALKKRGY